MAKAPPPIKTPFASFITDKKIVVIDPNGSSRAGLAKTLVEMGAKTPQITLLPNYESGQTFITAQLPEIVLTDFNLGNHCGLEFFITLRAMGVQSERSLFVIVTGDASESSVAQSAEGEIDAYILKPYTLKKFKEVVSAVAKAKFLPSPYQTRLREARGTLALRDFDGAKRMLEEACALDPTPTLALYYLAQVELGHENIPAAENHYRRALALNPFHYKALSGLLDLLVAQREIIAAYEVVRTLAKTFPVSPQRLPLYLKLAIATGNLSEIDEFYEDFKRIDNRSPELSKAVVAALIIAGKQALKTLELRTQGVELLKKAAITAAGKPSFLRVVVEALTQANCIDEAERTLKRFHAEAQSGTDYIASKLMVLNATAADPREPLAFARVAVRQGISDPLVFKVAIERLIELEKESEADDWSHQAASLWPDKQLEFSVEAIKAARDKKNTPE